MPIPLTGMEGLNTLHLSHKPNDILLPDWAPEPPEDIVSLINEWHEGLTKVAVSYQISRGRYENIGMIFCQESPGKKIHPPATPYEIAEYAMRLVQYRMEARDEAGKFKIELIGPSGKGRFVRSRHIDMSLSEGGRARSVELMDEETLVEKQSEHITQLYGQILDMGEMIVGAYKIAIMENKEMSKIMGEALRKNADIEMARLNHQVQVRMLDEEAKEREEEAARQQERWQQGMDYLRGAKVAERIMGGLQVFLAKKMGMASDTPEDLEAARAAHAERMAEDMQRRRKEQEESRDVDRDEAGSEEAEHTEGGVGPDEMEEYRRMAEMYPLRTAANALRLSLDEKKQWKMVYDKLDDDQSTIFDEILGSESEKEIESLVKRLATTDISNLVDLQSELDDQQRLFVEILMSVI
jgi:hypothetical protein